MPRLNVVGVPFSGQQPPARVPIAGVPRNFAAGHMLAMVTLFALVFSLLAYLRAGHEWYVVSSLFIVAVILGQMFLFHGREPRRASCLAGACTMPFLAAGVMIAEEGTWFLRNGWPSAVLSAIGITIGAAAPAALLGAVFGYLIGTLCAGIFLVTERRWDAGQVIDPEPIIAEVVPEGDGPELSRPALDDSADGDPWSHK